MSKLLFIPCFNAHPLAHPLLFSNLYTSCKILSHLEAFLKSFNSYIFPVLLKHIIYEMHSSFIFIFFFKYTKAPVQYVIAAFIFMIDINGLLNVYRVPTQYSFFFFIIIMKASFKILNYTKSIYYIT